MSGKKPDFIYAHGNTQTGKSSVILTITGGKARGIEAGDGSGESKTGANGNIPKPVQAMIGDRELIF